MADTYIEMAPNVLSPTASSPTSPNGSNPSTPNATMTGNGSTALVNHHAHHVNHVNHVVPPPALEVEPDVTDVTDKSKKHLERTFRGGLIRVWVTTQSTPFSLIGCVNFVLGHIRCLLNDIRHVEGWHKRLQLHLFRDLTLYHAALIEFVGTFLLTFMVIVIVSSILVHAGDYSYFPTAIALVHIPLIAFLILSTGSTSGGHLNPMISFATFVAGMTEFPRMIVYIIAQIVASIAASYTAKHMLPDSVLNAGMLAMCSIGTEQTVHQALTMEIFCDLFVLFVAFGVALDDRQRQVFAPWLAPFIIGTLIAMLIYTTSTLSAFGNGAIAYPTRCLGPAVAMDLVMAKTFTLGNGTVVNNAQWIYWIGPLISSLMIGALYRVSPPGYLSIVAERRSQQNLQTDIGSPVKLDNVPAVE